MTRMHSGGSGRAGRHRRDGQRAARRAAGRREHDDPRRADRAGDGTLPGQGGGELILLEAIAVMAHMGCILVRDAGCTPEDALELLKAFARVQMLVREPGGEEARPS